MAKTPSVDQTTLENALYWLQALVCQGERVAEAWTHQEGRHYPFLTVRMMEEQFFLAACNKARRWVEKLAKLVDDETPLRAFLTAIREAKVVRDKREHDDEYFGAGAKYPEEPAHDVQSTSPVQLNVGTSCTVLTDGKLLLGGIFDVAEGMRAARELAGILRHQQHAYWDSRSKGHCEHFKAPERLIGS